MTDTQKQELVDLLWGNMTPDKECDNRVHTGWGTKTQKGLIACIERIMEPESAN